MRSASARLASAAALAAARSRSCARRLGPIGQILALYPEQYGGAGGARRSDRRPGRTAYSRALNDVWWHAGGNVVVVLIELYNWWIRYTAGTSAVVPEGLVLSLIVVCILVFTGWKGWEMVYRARVGVADEPGGASDLATRASRSVVG